MLRHGNRGATFRYCSSHLLTSSAIVLTTSLDQSDALDVHSKLLLLTIYCKTDGLHREGRAKGRRPLRGDLVVEELKACYRAMIM